MSTHDQLQPITDEELRAWARGGYGAEAAVELLIRTGHVYRYARRAEDGMAWVDYDLAAEDVWPGGTLSGGERRVVAAAVSLSGHVPTFTAAADGRPFPDSDATSWWAAFSLAEVLPGLDRKHQALVLAAIAHAGGTHEHRDTSALQRAAATGQPLDRSLIAGEPLGPLYPWPDQQP